MVPEMSNNRHQSLNAFQFLPGPDSSKNFKDFVLDRYRTCRRTILVQGDKRWNGLVEDFCVCFLSLSIPWRGWKSQNSTGGVIQFTFVILLGFAFVPYFLVYISSRFPCFRFCSSLYFPFCTSFLFPFASIAWYLKYLLLVFLIFLHLLMKVTHWSFLWRTPCLLQSKVWLEVLHSYAACRTFQWYLHLASQYASWENSCCLGEEMTACAWLPHTGFIVSFPSYWRLFSAMLRKCRVRSTP